MSLKELEPVVGCEAWTPAELARDRSWELMVDDRAREELLASFEQMKAAGGELAALGRESFPLGVASKALVREVVRGVRDNRGFVVLRGLPTVGMSVDDAKLFTWGFSQWVGTCLSQNKAADLVAVVMDHGQKKGVPLERGYGTNKELELHIDLTDVVGLLFLRQSPASPPTLISSSLTVFNSFLRERPDLLARAMRGFHWDRLGEHAPWESPITPYEVPIFSVNNGKVSCRYNRHWTMSAYRRMNRTLDSLELEVFDFFDRAARACAFEIGLKSGDMYFASNFTVTHGKRGHESDPDDAETKRVLLRVWLNIPHMREVSDEEVVRWGLIRHGNLGWTGSELLKGLHQSGGNVRSLLKIDAVV